MPGLYVLLLIGWCAAAVVDDPDARRWLSRATSVLALVVVGRWLLRGVGLALRISTHRARSEALDRLAGELPRGEHEARGPFDERPAIVRGTFDDLPCRVVVRAEGVRGITLELWAWNSLVELDVTRPGLLARLRGELRKPAREHELDQALSRLLEAHGQTRVTLTSGVLRAEAPFSDEALEPSSVVSALRALARVARLVTREQVEAPRVAGRSFAWTSPGGRLRCPYCKDDLDPAAVDVDACPACRTLHHRECLCDSGGCTVLGCPAAPTPRERAGRMAERGTGRLTC